MSGIVWLASYPKSGNTWFRMLIANLSAKNDEPIDINKLPERGGIASARGPFDYLTLVESGLLTHEEADKLRPPVYEALALGAAEDVPDPNDKEYSSGPRFMKVHDAYTMVSQDKPLLSGALAAIVIVRDPRDVAISLAHHMDRSLDQAITLMGNGDAAFSVSRNGQAPQLRQSLLDWSGHIESWLDRCDLPVHLVRYEDMLADPESCFLAAMHFVGRPITLEDARRSARLADFSNLQSQERQKGFAERVSKVTPFFREGRAGGWRQVLTSEQITRIEADHQVVMRRLGYCLAKRKCRPDG